MDDIPIPTISFLDNLPVSALIITTFYVLALGKPITIVVVIGVCSLVDEFSPSFKVVIIIIIFFWLFLDPSGDPCVSLSWLDCMLLYSCTLNWYATINCSNCNH